MTRLDRMKQNQERIDALGLKHISTSLKDSSSPIVQKGKEVELIVIRMFCTYLELDMNIDVVICCVELVAIMFKFCTCELFDMDNGVDYDT